MFSINSLDTCQLIKVSLLFLIKTYLCSIKERLEELKESHSV